MNYILIFGLLIGWALIVVGCWLGWQLLGQNGRVLLRLDALEKQLEQSEANGGKALKPAQAEGRP